MAAARPGRAASLVTPPRVAPLIHLDTNFLIGALLQGSAEDRRLQEWLRAGELVAVSTIAWAEFLCGPLEEGQAELAGAVIAARLPFSDEEAVFAARLFNEAGRRRGSMVDCMIGATALRAGAALATADTADFQRFVASGLTLAR